MYTGIAEFVKEINVYAVHNVQGITGLPKIVYILYTVYRHNWFCQIFYCMLENRHNWFCPESKCFMLETGITGFGQKVSAICSKHA